MIQMTFNGNQFKNFSVKKGKAEFSVSLNQAVFDIQMLGFADYSVEDIEGKTKIIYNAFLDLCSYDRIFIDAVSRSTSSKLNERLTIWKNKLNLIMENPQPYLEKLEQKQQHFNYKPVCSSSGQTIETIDEADFVDGKLYHRFYTPSKQISPRISPNTDDVKFFINGEEYEIGNAKDTIKYVIDEFLTNRIKDDNEAITRLANLEFIGTHEKLSSRVNPGISEHLSSRVNKKTKTFKPLRFHNSDSPQLYIDMSGSDRENLENLKCMASLFSFMSDFRLI